MLSQVCSTLNPFYNKKTPWFTFNIITKNLEKNGKWSWNTISNISTWFQFFLPEQIVDDDHEISQLLSLLVQFFQDNLQSNIIMSSSSTLILTLNINPFSLFPFFVYVCGYLHAEIDVWWLIIIPDNQIPLLLKVLKYLHKLLN